MTRPHPFLNVAAEMPWELDGRTGVARIGLTRQQGFALMRDRQRQLVVFHAVGNEPFDRSQLVPPPMEEFVIPEDAFEPASNLDPKAHSGAVSPDTADSYWT